MEGAIRISDDSSAGELAGLPYRLD